MLFNKHFDLAGQHAFLSASKYHWINYTEEKLAQTFATNLAAQKGTQLHDFASMAIKLRQKMPRTRNTMNMYVNDAIGYRMVPEQVLAYSQNAFGTADAIGFRENTLRIFDLKTGSTRTSVHQLEVYNALFCLEYGFKPNEIEAELRIYQLDEVKIWIPDPDDIFHIMDRIVVFDKMINQMKMEAYS